MKGRTYVPLTRADGFVEVGLASWYGPGFHGKKTASGEIYEMLRDDSKEEAAE